MVQITEWERKEIKKRFSKTRFTRTKHKHFLIEDYNSFPFMFWRMLRKQITPKQFEKFRRDKMEKLNQSRGR